MKLDGLIQHSFALRVPKELRPLFAREGIPNTRPLLRAVFEASAGTGSEFFLGDAGMKRANPETAVRDTPNGETKAPWHSIIVSEDQTAIVPFLLPLKDPDGGLPTPLSWAEAAGETGDEPWQGFVFGGDDMPGKEECNDFLLEREGEENDDAVKVSRLLCQLLAHQRSQLFGLTLARNTFNVLLPHAVLDWPPGDDASSRETAREHLRESGKWIVQPAVYMFYVQGRLGFRPIFSFSLFLVPCEGADGSQLIGRPMRFGEFHDSVKTVWPLATAHELKGRPKFNVSGPLGDYLAATASQALAHLDLLPAGEGWKRLRRDESAQLSLRQFAEATLFALVAQMTRGPGASIGPQARRIVGDRVLTSLSASRVSSVVLVPHEGQSCDPKSECSDGRCYSKAEPFDVLMKVAQAISRPLLPTKDTLEKESYRINSDLFDRPGYEIAALPAERCLITLGSPDAQKGIETSALLEAGLAAYMAIGAATATGLIRNIFREIAFSDRSRPEQIAEIEREAMIDLHEAYDIEVAVESYRHHYQQLRGLLGIEDEYEALSRKLQALHRETSTRSEARAERRLAVLTWAIVILSAVIATGTLILIFKGG